MYIHMYSHTQTQVYMIAYTCISCMCAYIHANFAHQVPFSIESLSK